ncbi:hypothetical protein QZH41_016769 [Actinostola sp. cb2023]|nr:hypothetical protein QZH41_016769 [Actinostola sp. cb2023]
MSDFEDEEGVDEPVLEDENEEEEQEEDVEVKYSHIHFIHCTVCILSVKTGIFCLISIVSHLLRRFDCLLVYFFQQKAPENPLTEEMLAESLSLLCKTGNGLAHAYVRLDIHDKELTDVSILNCFIHLRYVVVVYTVLPVFIYFICLQDVCGNQLKDISSINSLTHLLTLKCDRNQLHSAKLDELPYLQIASFANNKIMDTEGISHPLLEHLNLSYNEIVEVAGLDAVKLNRLAILELRGNKLMNTNGLNITNLKELYLGANTIKAIEGFDRLEHLTKLHLRDNQIDKLDGFSENMKNLQYLNLRGNSISDVKEVNKIKCLPLLRAVLLMAQSHVISENPVSDEDDYRIEVLISLRRLERLDKDEYTDDERQEAEEVTTVHAH